MPELRIATGLGDASQESAIRESMKNNFRSNFTAGGTMSGESREAFVKYSEKESKY